VILSVLINLMENISQYDVSHSDIVSINKPSYWKVSVSMMSHTVILSVLINLLESISQYDISHSDIVSINKSTGKYQSV
jgi:K+-sensing histidine kinase KdpD